MIGTECGLSSHVPEADGFYPALREFTRDLPADRLWEGDARVVRGVLRKSGITAGDFAVLLSPAGGEALEDTARRAHGETLRVFGLAKQLFAPLYLGNYCTNRCVYCGFEAGKHIERKVLSPDEVEAEAGALAATGIRKVLALTGDAPKRTGAEYIARGVSVLARHFSSVGIEVQALTEEEYALVCRAGADSLTMFQETYDAGLYARLHLAGPKRDFAFRLDAPHRAARAGMRGVTLGALLGLGDWRFDIFMLGMHAAWMQRRFPHLEISFSLPRIRPRSEEERCKTAGSEAGECAFTPVPVTDREFVQALVALRCFLPQAGITLSTRENSFLRDRLLGLGVTKVSAGVSTAVGGYAAKPAETSLPGFPPAAISPSGSALTGSAPSGKEEDKTGRHSSGRGGPVQFVIDDVRSVSEMARDIELLGYQPVFADWLLPNRGDMPLAGGVRRALGGISGPEGTCFGTDIAPGTSANPARPRRTAR